MFDVDGTGTVQVSLLPQETLHIPFTLLTLRPRGAAANGSIHAKSAHLQRSHRGRKPEHKGAGGAKEVESSVDDEDDIDRDIEVRFISASHGHVVAVLKINVCYRSAVIDRNIMFYEPENSVMKQRIQLVDDRSSHTVPGQRCYSTKYIHCVENVSGAVDDASGSQVLVEWGPSEDIGSNGLDIIIRYRCGSFPDVGSFYILVYDDPFQASLYEVILCSLKFDTSYVVRRYGMSQFILGSVLTCTAPWVARTVSTLLSVAIVMPVVLAHTAHCPI